MAVGRAGQAAEDGTYGNEVTFSYAKSYLPKCSIEWYQYEYSCTMILYKEIANHCFESRAFGGRYLSAWLCRIGVLGWIWKSGLKGPICLVDYAEMVLLG